MSNFSISTLIFNLIDVLSVILPILLAVAFMTIIERKQLAAHQRRVGPNTVGYYGVLQPFSDALKLILKETIIPSHSNKVLFYLAPVSTLVFSLLGWAIIPFGKGLAISDLSLGILYTLALSSLGVYGILFAGWSANSKYAFLGSKWPLKDVNLYLKQTVSEKFIEQKLFNLQDTLCVTPCFSIIKKLKFFKKLLNNLRGSKVKMLVIMDNLQVTKAFNSWVGTSEAIRLLSIKYYTYLQKKIFITVNHRNYIRVNHPKNPGSNNKAWNQWLAGLIDGDGSFHLTKKGYASLDITMDIRDEHALHIVKNVYGGSIKLVSGNNTLRYCLRHKEGFLSLVNDVNGEIRNSNRLLQLNKICLKYEIPLIFPDKLQYENGWLSGFFDADGSVTLNQSNGQLAITLTQKTTQVLSPLIEIYGGSIYIDRTNNSYKWYISDKEGILKLIEYFKKYPSRSLKKNRLHLIPKCFKLKDMGAHKATCDTAPFLLKSWQLFICKWKKFEV